MKKFLVFCSAISLLLSGCSNNDDPKFGPVANVSNLTDLQVAIYGGSTDITYTQPLTQDALVFIPNFYPEGQSLTIKIPDAGEKSITFMQRSISFFSYPELVLDIDPVTSLVLETPDMNVSFSGWAGTLTSSASTLTIENGAHVGTLNVKEGNIRLFGTVDNYTLSESTRILRPVSDGEELRTKLNSAYDQITNSGVVLTDDVNLTLDPISGIVANQNVFSIGDPNTPENDDFNGYVFDGNGYTISGAAWNNVLAIFASNVTVSNLTVLQTTDEKTAKANNGITIYRQKGVVLNNVTVMNCGKGGVIVNSSEVTANNLTVSGNAWGGVNLSQGGSPMGGGGPEFTLTSGTFTGQANPIWVESTTKDEYSITLPSGWSYTTDSSTGHLLYVPGN